MTFAKVALGMLTARTSSFSQVRVLAISYAASSARAFADVVNRGDGGDIFNFASQI